MAPCHAFEFDISRDITPSTPLLLLRSLGNNRLGILGGKAIAVALEKNAVLKNLNLSNNDLGSEGGKWKAVRVCGS